MTWFVLVPFIFSSYLLNAGDTIKCSSRPIKIESSQDINKITAQLYTNDVSPENFPHSYFIALAPYIDDSVLKSLKLENTQKFSCLDLKNGQLPTSNSEVALDLNSRIGFLLKNFSLAPKDLKVLESRLKMNLKIKLISNTHGIRKWRDIKKCWSELSLIFNSLKDFKKRFPSKVVKHQKTYDILLILAHGKHHNTKSAWQLDLIRIEALTSMQKKVDKKIKSKSFYYKFLHAEEMESLAEIKKNTGSVYY